MSYSSNTLYHSVLIGHPTQNYGHPSGPQPGYGPYAAQPGPYPGQGVPPGGAIMNQPGGTGTSQVIIQPVVMGNQPLANPPKDYLIMNIFACLCCCCLIGIFGIIKSSSTRDAIKRGDEAEAMRHSKTARQLLLAAVICGIIIITVNVILRFTVFATSSYSSRFG